MRLLKRSRKVEVSWVSILGNPLGNPGNPLLSTGSSLPRLTSFDLKKSKGKIDQWRVMYFLNAHRSWIFGNYENILTSPDVRDRVLLKRTISFLWPLMDQLPNFDSPLFLLISLFCQLSITCLNWHRIDNKESTFFWWKVFELFFRNIQVFLVNVNWVGISGYS